MKTRHLIVPLLALVALLMLAGCQTVAPTAGEPAAPAEAPPGATPTAAEIVITSDRVGLPSASKSFSVHLHVAFSQDSPVQRYADAARVGMVAWLQAHPEWAVETRLFTNSVGSLPGLLEEARAGRAPDCANIVPEYFPAFKDNGYLKPITAYFSAEELADFFPYIQRTVTFDGEVYAYWFYTDERVIFRRTDLVPDAPRTWDDLKAAALAAEQQDGAVDGFLFNGGRWGGTWADWIAYFWSQGGELTDAEKAPIFHEGENREYMLNMLRFVRELVDSGASPERVVNITSYADFVEAAANGTVAMFMGVDSQYAQLQEALPAEEFAKWAVSVLPGRLPDQYATLAGGWSFGVLTADTEKAAMCIDFLKSVYGGDFNGATGLLPSRASIYADYDVFSTPAYQAFADGLQYGHPQPITLYTPAMSNSFQVMIGDILTGAATPEEALDTMAAEVLAAYADSQE